MSRSNLPAGARPSPLPANVSFHLAVSAAQPPEGEGWLYEVKHDGHRLPAIVNGWGALRLVSRNGHDRTPLFAPAFAGITDLGRSVVLDGEIAAPDAHGVTHLDDLQSAIGRRRRDGLPFFAFDLLHLDGHDLRVCPLIERKALLRELLSRAGCPRVVYVDHVAGDARRFLEAARKAGAEGIVSKRAASAYGAPRAWLKTKFSEVGAFVVTGYRESAPGRIEAIRVSAVVAGRLRPAGEVRFGVGREMLLALEKLKEPGGLGTVTRVRPELAVEVKFFGRHRSGAIRDGVVRVAALLGRRLRASPTRKPRHGQWRGSGGSKDTHHQR